MRAQMEIEIDGGVLIGDLKKTSRLVLASNANSVEFFCCGSLVRLCLTM